MFAKITENKPELPGKNFGPNSLHGKSHDHDLGCDERKIGNETTIGLSFVGTKGERRDMIKPTKGQVHFGDHGLSYATEQASN